MKLFRFSPIKDKTQLFKAIEYIHFESFRLCKQNLGYYLPVAGNVGVFCHYEDEFERLIKIRKELTDLYDNWNQKYFRLHKPIVIPAKNDIPETTYTYLYIRKPDPSHHHVGDVDFYLEPNKYRELKGSLLSGKIMKGVRIFERPDLDLIRLYDSDSDISAFVGKKKITEDVREGQI
ncbi:MAG TPA: hypothetical protein VMW41_02405 [Candidatus Bathyarchaeia archaeon]|nr:hypothetical protein [Candidatus Bathyarchaeia archaeon]